jgi:tape measure domain-containing protein
VKGAAERLNRTLSGTNTLLPTFGTLVRTAGSMLRDLIGHAIRSGSEIENLELAFTTMLGGADAARAHLEELQRFAIGKPFEFAQLASASRLLQTFGFQARDVTGLLTDFGDAAFTANTGFEGVERMSRVFGQIRATGKTTVGHLNMLVRSGVPAYDILRERLGLTGEELQKIARSGIPAERVITALREGMRQRFSGGLDRAAATLAAKLSDLQDLAGLTCEQGLFDSLREIGVVENVGHASALGFLGVDRESRAIDHGLEIDCPLCGFLRFFFCGRF